jgi:hypothetical protein
MYALLAALSLTDLEQVAVPSKYQLNVLCG